jgi:glycosyltransferase involved in cell wall biosynthesis
MVKNMTYEHKPIISVIIPTYNRGEYICETIESVFEQTYKDFEIIIVDDGSTDDTRQLIEPYLSRIKYIYQENAGVSAARNTGIIASESEYVAFLDSDDLWLTNKLKLQMEFLDSNPQLGMVYADACMFSNDQIIYSSFLKLKKFTSYGYIFGNLIKEDFIITSTVLVRREVFKDVGTFDESLSVAEDYDMWLRIARKYQIGLINECLVKYRKHNTNISSLKSITYPDMEIRVLKKHEVSEYPDQDYIKQCIKKRMAELYFSHGYVALEQENNKMARADFFRSLVYGRLKLRTIFLIFLTLTNPIVTNNIRNIRRKILALLKA